MKKIALNRLTRITSPENQIFNFTYDALNRRLTATRPNSVTTTYGYDLASQLTNLEHRSANPDPLAAFSYVYDKVGNRTAVSVQRSAVSVNPALSYVYDEIYRLTQATRPLAAEPDETFNYDLLGNRLKRDGQVADARFNAGNRLLEDAEFTYAYDDNGNLITRT